MDINIIIITIISTVIMIVLPVINIIIITLIIIIIIIINAIKVINIIQPFPFFNNLRYYTILFICYSYHSSDIYIIYSLHLFCIVHISLFLYHSSYYSQPSSIFIYYYRIFILLFISPSIFIYYFYSIIHITHSLFTYSPISFLSSLPNPSVKKIEFHSSLARDLKECLSFIIFRRERERGNLFQQYCGIELRSQILSLKRIFFFFF